jgi:hypothetical protein
MKKVTIVLAVLAIALASPALALNVTAGVDLWETSDNGGAYIDFRDNPIPAGTFCDAFPGFSDIIPVKGKRIKSTPDLGTTDTIIERLNDVDLQVGGPAGHVDIVIRVLSLQGKAAFSACGESWAVDAYTDPDQQTTSKLSVKATSTGGGSFSANLDVNGTVRFVSSKGTVTITDKVNLVTNDASWATNPKRGVKAAGPIKVDSNGDGIEDLGLPGTSNFHPGWNGGTPVPVPHSGPHPTQPPQPCVVATTPSSAVVVQPQPTPNCSTPVIINEIQPVNGVLIGD